MSTFAKFSKFEKVYTPACGAHKVVCEFSETMKLADGSEYKIVRFYEPANKTFFEKRFKAGQINYLFTGLARKLDALAGLKFSEIIKYLAANEVELFVTKDEKYGLQIGPYAPKA